MKNPVSRLTVAAATALATVAASSAFAQYEKGPDPTSSALERAGSFATRTVNVSSLGASGFGGGRIWYPTASGSYGVVAVSPGFTGTASTMYFWGERLSSHGFVVIVIETNTLFDQPGSRARQLTAALDYVVGQGNSRTSPLYGKVDGNRRAVAGHSMGGGGTLIAAADNVNQVQGVVAHDRQLPPLGAQAGRVSARQMEEQFLPTLQQGARELAVLLP